MCWPSHERRTPERASPPPFSMCWPSHERRTPECPSPPLLSMCWPPHERRTPECPSPPLLSMCWPSHERRTPWWPSTLASSLAGVVVLRSRKDQSDGYCHPAPSTCSHSAGSAGERRIPSVQSLLDNHESDLLLTRYVPSGGGGATGPPPGAYRPPAPG
eukprot:363337-Chlamydomonas_euryale.AAC.1